MILFTTINAGGNITSAKTYPYTTGSISGSPLSQKTYSYSSSGWKDLLTNFNGDSIIYDEIGNPTQYRNGMNIVWENGRRLASITQGTNSYSYSYDSSGVRISKTVNGTTYSYIYDNGQLIYADTPLGGMTFFYENDSVVGYKYGPEYYYYIKNLQGDIIGVIDKNCNLLYQYEYDAWGNHTVLDAQGNTISPDAPHVANFNPLRYRGYFFDAETGLYYLLSRYYDPETGRFISPDNDTVLNMDYENIVQYNLYAYCFNNPINMVDDGGYWPTWLKKAVAVVAVAAVVVTAAVVTVSTFGAGSVAGVAAISATATLAARTTEVAALQVKKGKQEGKSGSQIAKDTFESIFDNGDEIVGITPVTKATSVTANHLLSKEIAKLFNEKITLKSTLKSAGGKFTPTVFAAWAWGQALFSIFSDDPVKTANQRGYTLK